MERLKITLALMACALVLFSGRPPLAAPDWSSPVNVGLFINSAFDDEGPAISGDGLSLYFTSNRPGGAGGQDIYVAHREAEDGPWGAPVNVAMVNSTANDFAPTFSQDGHHMFFVSTRPGGAGGADIWVSFREDIGDDFGWNVPENLGAVNTTFNDAAPGWARQGNAEVLYLTSNRPGGPGPGPDPDIYVGVRQEDGSFGPPVLVGELNSAAQDARATVRRNGRELFLFSNRAGSLGLDLWTSARMNWLAPWSTPVNLGDIVNSPADEMQPNLSGNGTTLFFASNRPNGFGRLDLYMTTRRRGDDK